MLLGRLGSLNALEQGQRNRRAWWKRLLGPGQEVPSADTMARVQARYEPEDFRVALSETYGLLKRRKVLPAPGHGLIALVLDGHDSNASYLRHCAGCLERKIRTASGGVKTLYFHRHVVAMLAGDGWNLLVDEEPQRPGEDEVAAATRLVRRVHQRYARAYDVVLADALYARVSFFRTVVGLGKDVQVVLKHDEWALTKEVRALCELVSPTEHMDASTRRVCWDLSELPWSEFERPVRVVRSEETTPVKRQITEEVEETTSSWLWVSTLSKARAPTRVVVDLGHRRWGIENEGFNEGVNAWHMDHVYHHEPRAMEVMLLLLMLAYNLFHVFYDRNLKPALRRRASPQHIGREITAELYAAAPKSRAPP